MATKRNIYNEDKANSVLAVKLRKLFEENNKVHAELAEYIEKQGGGSFTRQAIGQWCNGNTCPNLKTVPIIAKFFGVSTDYLLTDTDIKTPIAERQAILNWTGLTEKALLNLYYLKNQHKSNSITVNDMHFNAVEGVALSDEDKKEAFSKVINHLEAEESRMADLTLKSINLILETVEDYNLLSIISEMMWGEYENPYHDKMGLKTNEIMIRQSKSSFQTVYDINKIMENNCILRINDTLKKIKHEYCNSDINKKKAGG
ncbi:MAG: helix-turn-helix transcriptional regulator [Oscillospiraceae bacterium]|nr:helix-turn-helix transcriptional regulator [Oscillospiraceae bacterium]